MQACYEWSEYECLVLCKGKFGDLPRILANIYLGIWTPDPRTSNEKILCIRPPRRLA